MIISRAARVCAAASVSMLLSQAISADEAVRAAAGFGFPVALKLESPDLLHKSDAGVVKLNLRNREEVLDLMAYLLSRGDRNSEVFRKP